MDDGLFVLGLSTVCNFSTGCYSEQLSAVKWDCLSGSKESTMPASIRHIQFRENVRKNEISWSEAYLQRPELYHPSDKLLGSTDRLMDRLKEVPNKI